MSKQWPKTTTGGSHSLSPKTQTTLPGLLKQDMAQAQDKELKSMMQKMEEKMEEKLEKNERNMEKMFEKMETMVGAMGQLGQALRDVKQELKDDINQLDTKIDNMQKNLDQNNQKITKVENKTENIETRMEEMEERHRHSEAEKDKIISQLEMDRAEFYLRFQNIKEGEEDLVELIAAILTDPMQKPASSIRNEIDETFRVHTRYAVRNRLPREVHVRFTRKAFRNEILQKTKGATLMLEGKEIKILKQIPRRIRERRREYYAITKKLIARNINFRWLTPEGILVFWGQERHRLDSIDKATQFDYEYLQEEQAKREKEKEGENKEEERQEQLIEITSDNGTQDTRPREMIEPREQRITRAANPKYK